MNTIVLTLVFRHTVFAEPVSGLEFLTGVDIFLSELLLSTFIQCYKYCTVRMHILQRLLMQRYVENQE